MWSVSAPILYVKAISVYMQHYAAPPGITHTYLDVGAYEMRLCALECNWPVVLSTFLRHATHVTLLLLGETWSLGRQFMILT